jgi:hypothetical protein
LEVKLLKNSILRKSKILLFLLLLFCLSCASKGAFTDRTALYRNLDRAIYMGSFEGGIAHIIQLQANNSPLYDSRNAVSLFIDKGMLEFYAGRHRDSANSLQNAERLIAEAFTRSITENFLSYIVNDNTREYPGEDFEDIYISVFNALNYFHMRNIDGALVEVRKLTIPNGKLCILERKYNRGNNLIQSSASVELSAANANPETTPPPSKRVTFTNSALARYLSVLFYQAEGNPDAVRIEIAQLRSAMADQPRFYRQGVPDTVEKLQQNVPGQARLDILSFTGLSPVKEEQIFHVFWPFFRNNMLRFPQIKLPTMVKRPNSINRIEIIVNNERFNLELIEDLGEVIVDTFNARYTNVSLKTYIRTLLKYTALDALDREANRNIENASTGMRLLRGTGVIAAKAIFDASERADVRMSRFLPDKAYIGAIHLPPGRYNVTVNYFDGRNIIRTDTKSDVHVRMNTVNLIQTTNLNIRMEDS